MNRRFSNTPIPAASLRPRGPDGSYPYRGHRTVAELWAKPREQR